MKSQTVVVTLTAVIVLSTVSSALSQPPKFNHDEVKALIAQLASQNPKPTLRRGPDLKYPPNYDREKQQAVRAAKRKLASLGTQAFSQLIETWGDERYSLTYSVGINGYMQNATVGDICEIIVYDQIQPYGFWPRGVDDPRGKPHRPSYPSVFLDDAKSATDWLEKHKEKSLYEIQLMVINWVIDEESKRPNDFTDAERKELSVIRAKLIKTRTAISSGNYYMDDYD